MSPRTSTTRTVLAVLAAVIMVTSVMAPAMALDAGSQAVSMTGSSSVSSSVGSSVESAGLSTNTSSTTTTQSQGSTSKSGGKVTQHVEELANAASSGDTTDSSLITQSQAGETLIQVKIEAKSGQASAAADAVAANGGSVNVQAGDTVEAFIPTDSVDAIASSSAIGRISLPTRVDTTGQGTIVSEGLSNINASELHSQGISGEGVTIGIIDTGFNVSNPEINDSVAGFVSFDGEGKGQADMDNTTGLHGTAVAEIVADVAPNASLVLMEAETTTQIRSATNNVVEPNNLDVVSMSLGTSVGPFDGSSFLDYEIAQSFQNGTAWFVSSGNAAGGKHLNQTWNDADTDRWHEFSTGDETLNITAVGSFRIYVNWNDWPSSFEDYDIYLNDSSGNPVDNSTLLQNGSKFDNPVEVVSASSGGEYTLMIQNYSANGTADFDIFASDGVNIVPNTSTRSVTRPATEEYVIAVGAVDYADNSLRSYSSRGPLIDGDRKPELVGPDGVSTSVYGDASSSTGFTGTSAAAPHVAGVAALLKGETNAGAVDLVNALAQNATPLLGTEPNNETGWGLVNATGSLENLQSTTGESGESIPAAPYISSPNQTYDPTTSTDLSVTYNATDQVGSLSDLSIEIVNESGTKAAENASLNNIKDVITFSISAENATGDETLHLYLLNKSASTPVIAHNTTTLAASSSDSTPPAVTRALAVDLNNSDGNVTDGNKVRVSVNASDSESGITSVTADASKFGGGTVTLSKVAGEMYNGTFTVDEANAAGNGSYAIPVTAVDDANNVNDTEQTNALQFNTTGGDVTAPKITDFSVSKIPDGSSNNLDLLIGFDSSEKLSSIELNVTDSTGDLVYTYTESDIGTTDSSAPYHYSNSTTGVRKSIITSPGTYTFTLTAANDSAGNNGGGNATTRKFVVASVTLKHVNGTQPQMSDINYNVWLSSGLLQVQLRDSTGNNISDRTDLTDVGVEANTTFALNVTVFNWTPRLILGAGRNATWNVSNVGGGYSTVNITTQPANVQLNESKLTESPLPWSKVNVSDFSANASVDMAVSNLDLFDESRRDLFNDTMLMTDAQSFGFPQYDPQSKTLSLSVQAPHFNVRGNVNNGFFEAFLPNSLLSDWGVSDPANISVSALGSSTQPASSSVTADGIRLQIPIHYSSGTVKLSPASSGSSTGTIEGYVTNESGAPISGVDIDVRNATLGTLNATATTDSTGFYSVSVSEGTYDVAVDDETYKAPKIEGVPVTAGQTTSGVNFTVDKKTASGKTGFINGTVTNSTGDTVSGVGIIAYNDTTSTEKFTTTNKSGVYSFEVTVGTWQVFVDDPDYQFESASDVQVTENATTVVDLTVEAVPPKGYINGTVKNSDGNPVPSASVEVHDSGYNYFEGGLTNAEGNFSIRTPAANYTVRIEPTPSSPQFAPKVIEGVRVRANETTNLTVNLKEPGYINGTVKNGSGPVKGVAVVVETDEGSLFNETNAQGEYNITVPPGDHVVSVFARGQDAPSKDVSVTAGAVNETNFTLRRVGIVHQSVKKIDGPGDGSSIGLNAFVDSGFLFGQLVNKSSSQPPGAPYELEGLGVNDSTKFRINLTVTNFTASSLLWGLDDADFSTSPAANVQNGTNVTITGSPVTLQVNFTSGPLGPLALSRQDPSQVKWPTGQSDQATDGRNETVYFGLFDLSTLPEEIQNSLNGVSITTNAQVFSAPRVKNNSLRVWVAAPSRTVDGTDHTGFYQATIPDSQLQAWNVTNPKQELTALYKGDTANFTVTNLSNGARIRIENITYSAGFVEIQAQAGDSTPPSIRNATATDATNGDGNVSDGENITVSANVSDSDGVKAVVANASAFGAGNVTLHGTNSDGVYNATFAVNASNASSLGSHAITIIANDTAGNVATARTNTLARVTCINQAVAGSNGEIGLSEIQDAINWWAEDTPVPDTGGKTIGLSKIQDLINWWAEDTTVSCKG